MKQFDDDIGFFWQREAPPRAAQKTVVRGPRVLPPVPDTGWTPPDSFPDLSSAESIALDTETYDPDLREKGPGVRRDGYIVGVSLATDNGFRAYYPIRHKNSPMNLPPEHVMAWLKRELSRPRQRKIGANILYDLDYLAQAGVTVAGPLWDVQLAEALLNEHYSSYALEAIARRHLGRGKEFSALYEWARVAWGSDSEHIIKGNIYQTSPTLVGPYAESDAALPLELYHKQVAALATQNLTDIADLEMSLIPMMLGMRRRGVRVNIGAAEELSSNIQRLYAEARENLCRSAGGEISENSADDIARVLKKQGVEFPLTGRGKPSFRKPWLEQRRKTVPLIDAVLECRRLAKFDGTFVRGYILDSHINGRVYTQFHQLRDDANGTISGRFSSSGPNLQNIPIRDPQVGKLVRNIFVPEDGEDWWKLDWSQIEYRLIVHYATLIKAPGARKAADLYLNDPATDFHKAVAAMTGLERGPAKNLNFGLAYGQGIALLCYNLGVDREEGERIIAQYHQEAPFVQALSRSVMKRASKEGYIRTLLGRRRRFELWEPAAYNPTREEQPLPFELAEKKWPDSRLQRAYTYAALNALIQGSAADIMKKAMVMIQQSGVLDVLGYPSLTVHDELDGSKPRTRAADEAFAEVKNIMETCVKLNVPLIAEGGTGPAWGSIQ